MDPNTRAMIFGAAGVSGAAATYIEDVFSTWLYTGNGATGQTISNGIDLAGKGGLVWIKSRSAAEQGPLYDTARGVRKFLNTDLSGGTSGESTASAGTGLTAFNANGFSLGDNWNGENSNGTTYASWTFRKAAKFFDVVTYTGNGTNRTIAHNLGSVPGCIIVKRTDSTGNWQVYHTSLANTEYLVLNSLNPKATGTTRWNSTTPTSTVFSLGTDATVNANTGTYVAYLFAHDAGGFGDSGNESVIKCGSYTGNGSATGPTIDLGWEPQWLLIKGSSGGGNWSLLDNMRGIATGGNDAVLYAQANDAEFAGGNNVSLTATGFQITTDISAFNTNGSTYIYIAIRRGPMKTPTDATKVFALDAGTNATLGGIVTTGFPVDMDMTAYRTLGGVANVEDKVRGYGIANTAGATPGLLTSSTAAETTGSSPRFYNAWNTTITRGGNGADPGGGIVSWFFRRAPGFFDVVAYAETANPGTYSHSLGVAPEMMIHKQREATSQWPVYHKDINTAVTGGWPALNQPNGWYLGSALFATAPNATTFTVDYQRGITNRTHIAYLFASCPGVSKVGSYTGTGTTLQVNCGFTNGARFVLIKRTDNTGDWYVWDTARGIIAANDPYLLLNSSAAEVTNTDYIDPYSAGFEISSTAPAAINANGGTYIYLAIA